MKKFLIDENFGGKILDSNLRTENILPTKFWALWSRETYRIWKLNRSDTKEWEAEAIKETKKSHRYYNE